MCARRGAYVVVGIAGPGAEPIPMPVVMGRELRVVGSMNGDVGDLALSLEFLARQRGDVRLGPDVRRAGRPGAARASALAAMASLQTIKPVIAPAMG